MTADSGSETLLGIERAFGRRALLRGGAIAGAGLTAAALIGCGDEDEDTPEPSGAGTGGAGAPAKPKALNEELLALNDPKLPFPYVIAEPDVAVKKGGVIKLGGLQPYATSDPGKSTSGSTHPPIGGALDRLLSLRGNAKMNPFKIEITTEDGLARSFELAPDGLTYTFKLTDKAKFHNKPPVNGRRLTARDVKAVYDRYAGEGSVHRSRFSNVARMEAVDDTTFKITLKKPQPDVLFDMANRTLPIYAPELTQGENLLDKNTVIGSGPLIIDSFAPDLVKYVKNPEYWRNEVLIDGAELRVMPDPAARMAALRTGQLDWSIAAPTDIKTAEALKASNPDIRITVAPVLNNLFPMALNLKNAKFADERVRQGVSLGIDREKMKTVVFGGLANIVPGLPWIFAGFDSEASAQKAFGKWFKHDPAEAKKLLSAAGQTNLEFEFLYVNYTPTYENINVLMADSLKEIGVKVNLKTMDNASFTAKFYTAKDWTDAGNAAVGGGATADNFYNFHVHSKSNGNIWFINDADIDGWAEQQSSEVDPKKRADTIRKIWDRMMDKMYRVPKLDGMQFNSYPAHLMNYRMQGPLLSITTNGDETVYLGRAWLNK